MKALLLWLCIFFLATTGSAQSVHSAITVSGGSYEANDISFDWNIGELSLIQTFTSSDGEHVLTNGLLQPHSLYPFRLPTSDSFEIKISPNPTVGKLWVNLISTNNGILVLSLVDGYGRILNSRYTVIGGGGISETFDLTPYAAGTYFVRVEFYQSGITIKKTRHYKIIKL